jgi:L-malate glycosyltransferase
LHLIIFTENNQNGGLDTFISSLINNWPNNNDEFTIICNKSHPGLANLRKSIDKKVTIIEHNIPLVWDISRKLFKGFPNNLLKPIRYILRIFIIPVQYLLISNIFKNIPGDRLLVVNGGYPGGDSCRVANISWFNLGKGKSIHNFHNFATTYRFGFGWYERFLDRKLIKSTTEFISVSKACAASLNERGALWNEVDIKHIYNGISDKTSNHDVNLREDLNIGNSPLCLMLCTYEDRKGHEFIFRAFEKVLKKIPNAYLVICGGSTDVEYNKVKNLKDRIAPHKNIMLLNFIPNGANLISQSDLLLIGSQSFESFGYTAVEAMIREIPIVSTNIGGLSEVIKNNDGGFIFGKDDYIGFANQILLLLSNKKLRMKIGIKGKKRAISLFSSARMSMEYFNMLDNK